MPETDPPTPQPAPIWAPCSVERAILPSGSTLPPAPPGCRYVPVKGLGVVIADDDLRKRVDRRFHKPMILLALLVLPLLIIDFMYIREGRDGSGEGPDKGALWWLVISGLTIVWIAFTLEFVVKIAVAENRIEYLKRNWIDLFIIVVPVLRPLRVAGMARTTRVFRLRGVGFKFARYVFTLLIGLEATNRMSERLGFKPRKARIDPEEMTRHQLIAELKKLRRLSDDWSAWHAQQRAYLARNNREPMPTGEPHETASGEDRADLGQSATEAAKPSQTSAK